MIGIYKITSPKKRVYIGQSVDIKRRFKEYRSLRCKNQHRLYNSLKKYGVINHIFEVIEYCDIEELNNKERYYQELYSAISRNGLNCRVVSDDCNSGYLSEETKQKIRDRDFSYLIGNDFRTGILHTDEIKSQIKNTLIENAKKPCYVNAMTGMFGNKNPFFGKKHSEKTIELLRENAKNNIKSIRVFKQANIARQHLLLNTQTGIYYESIREASCLLFIKNSTLKAMLSGRFRNNSNLIKV